MKVAISLSGYKLHYLSDAEAAKLGRTPHIKTLCGQRAVSVEDDRGDGRDECGVTDVYCQRCLAAKSAYEARQAKRTQ